MKECPRCKGSGIEQDMTATDDRGCFDSKECEVCFGIGEVNEIQEFVESLRVLRNEVIFKQIEPYAKRLNDWLTRK